MIFLDQLLKYTIISLLIDVFKLISHSTHLPFPMTNIQCTQCSYKCFLKRALFLRVIDKMSNEIFQRIDKIQAQYIISKVGDIL